MILNENWGVKYVLGTKFRNFFKIPLMSILILMQYLISHINSRVYYVKKNPMGEGKQFLTPGLSF